MLTYGGPRSSVFSKRDFGGLGGGVVFKALENSVQREKRIKMKELTKKIINKNNKHFLKILTKVRFLKRLCLSVLMNDLQCDCLYEI